ncbi:hypothetical protein GOP47_0003564 [Adiantum capillus-veneris]|uniref:Reverse transcriptase domain-containing protein n=1 Tax=Adiantum capillus-veneris TaxID=13818 RepID=A0A9D4VC71_ADICA|nr:hypothetical protein GOP47_0003564 [Adiantum capillus-veneris]
MRDSISRVKKSDGTWTSSKLDLAQEIVSHFLSLFMAPSSPSSSDLAARSCFLDVVQPIMDHQQAADFEGCFTEEELLNALKAMAKGKSPGWDGLTVEFYLRFWEQFKDILLSMINHVWCNQSFPSSWKHGLIKLLPKRSLAEKFDDWRPVTMMPVIYKLVSKMVVHRIKDVLQQGLHPRQYGFIPRRQIHDNIATVLFAIEYAKYTQQDVLMLQVDIAKAFDTIQWDFISQVMSKLGFGPKMRNIVYLFYLNAYAQCLLAGEATLPWNLGRSVRQGCPLSAFLYAIATHPLLLYLETSS